MSEKEYRKLPGKGLRSSGIISPTRAYCSLWLGADHLLQIDSQSGYTEEYKRFYLRDIQAITLRKTSNWLVWISVLAALFLIFAAFALAVEDNVGSAVLWVIAGVFGLFLAIHLARGSTCECHLKTAVQTEQLPSLKRLRNARKALAIIRPLIEQTQGSFGAEELIRPMNPEISPGSAPQSPLIPPHVAPVRPPPLVRSYKGIIHPLFFGILLFSGLLDGVHIFFHPVGFVAFEAIVSSVVIVLAVTALAKQHGTDLSKSLRTTTWISGGYTAVLLLIGYVQIIALSATNPELGGNQWELITKYAEMDPLTTPWLLIVLIINIAAASGLSFVGLFLFRNWTASRNRAEIPPALPTQFTT